MSEENYNSVVSLESFPMQIDVSLIRSHFVMGQEFKQFEEEISEYYPVKIDYHNKKADFDDYEKIYFEEYEKAENFYNEIKEARDDWEENVVAERRKEMMNSVGDASSGLGFGGA